MAGQRLYLFVGYPGSGKTTVAKLIAQLTGAVHIWSDRERRAMFAVPTHSRAESDQLYRVLNQKTDNLLAEGKSVIFDTNFNFAADRAHLRAIAEKYGAETCIIWMKTPKTLAKYRAMHERHRLKNGYQQTMTAADFERLTNHLQPPSENEPYVVIDGTNVTADTLTQQLGI